MYGSVVSSRLEFYGLTYELRDVRDSSTTRLEAGVELQWTPVKQESRYC